MPDSQAGTAQRSAPGRRQGPAHSLWLLAASAGQAVQASSAHKEETRPRAGFWGPRFSPTGATRGPGPCIASAQGGLPAANPRSGRGTLERTRARRKFSGPDRSPGHVVMLRPVSTTSCGVGREDSRVSVANPESNLKPRLHSLPLIHLPEIGSPPAMAASRAAGDGMVPVARRDLRGVDSATEPRK